VALSDHMKQPGMPVSVGLHAAVLVVSLVTFSSKPLPDAVEAVAVEIVDPSQLNEVTKGEKAPAPQPTPRVDRVDPKPEQNAPGEAKRQVNNDAQPKPQEATAKEERKEQAAVTPPPPPPPPVPVRPPQPKPPEPVRQATKPPPAPAPAAEEEEDEAEEVIRQANRRKAEEQRKLEQQRQAEERRRTEEQRLEAQRRETERRQTEERRQAEEARRQQEDQRRQAEDKRKQEEQRKVAEEARRKAEEQKKAQAAEAARKADEERKKREGEQAARNQQAIDNARRALLASREAPSNSGNTGQQVQRTPAAGAATATGARLSPSDRAALAGMIADQIRSCWSVPGSSAPSTLPQVRVALNQDGSLGGTPTLVNSSGDPAFRALADSGMRAIRQCAPFRIPARFTPTYNDWRSIVVQLNPAD
jgi:colicin import membrane protein